MQLRAGMFTEMRDSVLYSAIGKLKYCDDIIFVSGECRGKQVYREG